MAAITDSTNPTIVMGTHITHPAPGSTDRPSFSSLVGNVDSNVVKYSASMRVELSRGDMIDGLEEMAKEILNEYISYRIAIEKVVDASPKRLILYRAGISEGQFAHVIKQEVPRLKTACAALNISPKITVIAVNKRTHVRLFSLNDQNTTRSGNCPVGTVVDTDVTHPAQFDFFLLSHADGLGTSRPSRYSVLYDENNFKYTASKVFFSYTNTTPMSLLVAHETTSTPRPCAHSALVSRMKPASRSMNRRRSSGTNRTSARFIQRRHRICTFREYSFSDQVPFQNLALVANGVVAATLVFYLRRNALSHLV
jgi:hypothetical protein